MTQNNFKVGDLINTDGYKSKAAWYEDPEYTSIDSGTVYVVVETRLGAKTSVQSVRLLPWEKSNRFDEAKFRPKTFYSSSNFFGRTINGMSLNVKNTERFKTLIEKENIMLTSEKKNVHEFLLGGTEEKPNAPVSVIGSSVMTYKSTGSEDPHPPTTLVVNLTTGKVVYVDRNKSFNGNLPPTWPHADEKAAKEWVEKQLKDNPSHQFAVYSLEALGKAKFSFTWDR